jgi:hypothetical protein
MVHLEAHFQYSGSAKLFKIAQLCSFAALESGQREPFCTVLLKKVSESIAGVQIEEKECF